MPLRVLFVMPSFWPATRYGGPIESVLRLCQSLLEAGTTVSVVTTNADGEGDLDRPTDRAVFAEGVEVRYFRRFPRNRFGFSAELTRYLKDELNHWDLVHSVALFSYASDAAMVLSRRAGVPYVVSPQGTLMPWAFGSKAWKKVPYFELVERQNLKMASCVHVTSEEERSSVLRLVPESKVCIVPNGVELPRVFPDVKRESNRIVFLGRIHPVKGLDVLIPALSIVGVAFPGAEMLIAGPDEDGEWARISSLIAKTPHLPRIQYLGPVFGEKKLELLASASALVLPSHGENFGMVVAEALACKTPVVVSRNCPWRILDDRKAGFWVENTPERIADALIALLRDPERARVMGEIGPSIAAELGWKKVTQSMIACYENVVSTRRRR